jgi:hypothetical protein
MDPIDGMLKLHMFSGTWEHPGQLLVVLGEDEMLNNTRVKTFKLKMMAQMPCVCMACRGEVNQERYIFKDIWNEQEE